MSQKRIHAVIHGRVQGVFFRDYTQREAVRLALVGWVRNRSDGAVETVFEGTAAKVEEMLAWLATGSPLAQVSSVECHEEPVTGTVEPFTVRYDGG